MSERQSTGFLLAKAFFALAGAAPILLLALIMGGFATDSPSLTRSEAGFSFAIVFFLFTIPAFWPLRAFYRAVRDLAREVHRDESVPQEKNHAD